MWKFVREPVTSLDRCTDKIEIMDRVAEPLSRLWTETMQIGITQNLKGEKKGKRKREGKRSRGVREPVTSLDRCTDEQREGWQRPCHVFGQRQCKGERSEKETEETRRTKGEEEGKKRGEGRRGQVEVAGACHVFGQTHCRGNLEMR